jgi:hypothetical protein
MKIVYLVFVTGLLIAAMLTSTSSSDGISRKECATCHGGTTDYLYGDFFVEHFPETFIPGVTYDMDLCVVDSKKIAAGFRLQVSQGKLKIPDTEEMASATQYEAFHTGRTLLENDTACWTIQWMAPAFVDETIDFVARGTAVNADLSEKGDHGGYYLVKSSDVQSVNFGPFYSKMEKDKIHLTWSSIQEIDNKYFSLEKSIDGKSWELIYRINGKIRSFSLNKYRYIDHLPSQGVSYYRLSQTNLDGKTISHPEIVKIFNTKPEFLQKKQYSIGDQLVCDNTNQLTLFDLSGKEIGFAGKKENRIPDIQEGIYFLKSNGIFNRILITK